MPVMSMAATSIPNGVTAPVSAPIEDRTLRWLKVERVAMGVFGPHVPVDAANELAPPQDLPNESFHGVDGGITFLIGGHGGSNALHGIQELEIQRTR